jgi:hypothetical protein
MARDVWEAVAMCFEAFESGRNVLHIDAIVESM